MYNKSSHKQYVNEDDGHDPINLYLQKQASATGNGLQTPTLDFCNNFRTHTLNIDNAVKINFVNKEGAFLNALYLVCQEPPMLYFYSIYNVVL